MVLTQAAIKHCSGNQDAFTCVGDDRRVIAAPHQDLAVERATLPVQVVVAGVELDGSASAADDPTVGHAVVERTAEPQPLGRVAGDLSAVVEGGCTIEQVHAGQFAGDGSRVLESPAAVGEHAVSLLAFDMARFGVGQSSGSTQRDALSISTPGNNAAVVIDTPQGAIGPTNTSSAGARYVDRTIIEQGIVCSSGKYTFGRRTPGADRPLIDNRVAAAEHGDARRIVSCGYDGAAIDKGVVQHVRSRDAEAVYPRGIPTYSRNRRAAVIDERTAVAAGE
ncbi:hypothetical protein D3C72_1392880 [compost metagenome]